jgi:hypothetical protein
MKHCTCLNWLRQRDSLYLANFFQKDKVRELYDAQEKDAPESAWVKFNLYRSAAENKDGTNALDYLAEAVKLDSIYALEYDELSNMAYEKQRADEALRMLVLANEVFHYDPFLKLQMAQLTNELGDKERALQLLNKLRYLEWSQIYYPQMPQYLAGLIDFVRSGETSSQPLNDSETGLKEPTDLADSDSDTSRQKILHIK